MVRPTDNQEHVLKGIKYLCWLFHSAIFNNCLFGRPAGPAPAAIKWGAQPPKNRPTPLWALPRLLHLSAPPPKPAADYSATGHAIDSLRPAPSSHRTPQPPRPNPSWPPEPSPSHGDILQKMPVPSSQRYDERPATRSGNAVPQIAQPLCIRKIQFYWWM
jgi:hypothetical protein